MPDATITSTASTFGTISGVFSADQSTISGTISGIVPGTLTGSVGVPGPAGAAGAPGQGVPVGGTAGQYLQKIDGTNYNTDWVTVNLSGYVLKANNLSDLTNLATARDNLGLGSLSTPTFAGVNVPGSGTSVANLGATFLTLNQQGYGQFTIQPSQGIVFPDASVQTTAFTTAQLTAYLVKASNLSDLTSASSARTNLGLGSLAVVNDAPSDGSQYARKNGAWDVVSVPASYITSVSSPLSVTTGNLSVDLTGLATESWVTSQGYITTAILDGYALLSGASFSGFCDFINGLSSSGPVTLLDNGYLDASGLDGDSRRRIRFGAGNGGGSWGWGDFGFDGSNLFFGNNENLPETLATRSWVTTGFAPKASPVFTGNPTAPTPTFGDNDTSISTTAFVQAALAGGTAVAKNLEVEVRNQSGSTIPAGSIVYISGATGNKPLITLAQANNDANSAQTMGFTKTAIANNAFGYVIVRGEVENLDTSALTEGAQLYLSPTVAGAYTTTKPTAPQHLVYVGIVIRAHPTQGIILVAVQNGYELNELHDVAIGTLANNDLLAYESSTDLWKNKTAATLGLAAINSQAFTGTPSLPTGTTGVTQTAGDNTTALATTAFVTAAVPAFASTAQVVAATSTTTSLAPGNQGFLLTNPRLYPLAFINLSSVSGSGALSTSNPQNFTRQVYLSTLAVGRSAYFFGVIGTANGGFGTSTAKADQVDFSKKVWIGGYAMMGHGGATSYLGDANTMCRISLGGYSTNTTGNMTLKGIGLKKVGGVASTVSLTVHNGTTLTDVASSVTIPDGGGIHWQIYSDGTGNVTLYINGTQAATTTAGPTTATASGQACYREQVEAVATPGVRHVMNCNGGWFYTE